MEPSAAIQELKAMRDRNPERKGDTLLDLEKRDFDNYEHLLSVTHEEAFRRMRDAMYWISRAQHQALISLGVDFLSPAADETMKFLGITVETRRYENKEDQYKDGIYILKQGEIAYYIGLPERVTIETPSRRWVLRSNLRIGEERKVYHFLQ